MDHVEMEEIHNSFMELSQPPLSSLGMRGDISMSHSIIVIKGYGKDNVFMHDDLLDKYFHSFTIHVQAIAPSERNLPYKLHGQLGVIKNVDHGHSLGKFWEMKYHSGCTPLAPNITHLLKSCEKTMKKNKWWGNHLLYNFLSQSGDIMCWFHIWDFDPPPVLHMKAYVSLVMTPYIDDVLILIVGMIGGRMQGFNVPIGSEILHVTYASFFREDIGKTMIATLDILFPYEASH